MDKCHAFNTADMIERSEFPEHLLKHHVRGVMRTVVNEKFHIDDGLPEYINASKFRTSGSSTQN
jgi:hypothetical protein